MPSRKIAQYDPDRLPNGHFRKGNNAGKVNGTGGQQARLRDLTLAALDGITPEKLIDVLNSIYDLAITCPDMEVRLRAGMYYADRIMGRPRESKEISNERRAVVTLQGSYTPEQLSVLDQMRNNLVVVDPNEAIEDVVQGEIVEREVETERVEGEANA